ncbi:acyltransferase family protein [Endothiovibrio diazotrophicus]
MSLGENSACSPNGNASRPLPPPPTGHDPHLDLLRGLAALLVLFGHLRVFLFVDYQQAEEGMGPLGSAFYFLTGFGQQAVMIFFVLSGFFIHGAIRRAEERGRWSWSGYAVDRLARLWVVLIPALALTLFWDTVGQLYSDSGFYQGEPSARRHFGPDGEGVSLDPITLLGNLAFLNTIVVENYGSSSQLWSLANEFWYYVLFPLWLFAARRRNLALLAVALLLSAALPFHILFLFPVWLTGAALYEIHHRGWGRDIGASRRFFIAALLLLAAVLILSRFHLLPFLVKEYAIGFATATLLFALLHAKPSAGPRYRRVAGWLSRISYSLYLSHLAMIAALLSITLGEQRLAPSPAGFALFIGLALLALFQATALYHLFEQHTGRVRRYLHGLFPEGALR